MENNNRDVAGPSVRDRIDQAVGAAWAAFMSKLDEYGISYDDCDSGTYIDDPDGKKTFCFNASLVECDKYGGA